MILQQPFLGEGPEALQAVDVASTLCKFNPVIDHQVLAIKLQRLVGLEPVGVEYPPLFRMLQDFGHQGLRGNIVHYSGKYPVLALQHAKDLHSPSGTTAPGPLTSEAGIETYIG